MPSAHALRLGDSRSGLLLRPICGIFELYNALESFVHARPPASTPQRACGAGRKPLAR